MVPEVENRLMPDTTTSFTRKGNRNPLCLTVTLLATVLLVLNTACSGESGHTAEAISEKDSLPFMQSWGVSNLISDSGVIRYKIIAEEWDIYTTTQPPKWTFLKGLLLEKFDSAFHINWFVQADTAYCYNNQLWELRGRVKVRNLDGTIFRSEELFWDMNTHEIYSHQFVHIIEPDQELKAYGFTSDEQMSRYTFKNSSGSTLFENDETTADSSRTVPERSQVTTSIP